jgi:hypothetical protein
MKFFSIARFLAGTALYVGFALGQGKLVDYQRGQELQVKATGLVVNAPGAINWIGSSDHFWYAKPVEPVETCFHPLP